MEDQDYKPDGVEISTSVDIMPVELNTKQIQTTTFYKDTMLQNSGFLEVDGVIGAIWKQLQQM